MARSKSEYLVGRQIRIAANNAGMTLKTLGQKLGVSKPTIYAYATGALHVPENRLKSIAEITGHDIEFFSSPPAEEGQDLGNQLKLIDATLSPPDPRTASRLALAVIEREPDSDDALELAKLSFRAGNALLQHGDYLDAIQQLEHARRCFLKLGYVDFAANASQSLGFCYINLGRLEKAKDSFAYARDHLPPDQRWMGLIAMAALAERLGEFDQAGRELEKLLQTKKLQPEPLAYVIANLATLRCSRTDWQGALPFIEQALSAAHQNRQADLCVEMLVLLSQVLSREGRFAQASENLIRAYDIVLGLGDQSRQALVDAAWAELAMFAGELEEARSRAVSALSLATRGGYLRSEGVSLRVLAETALLRGDTMQCRDYAIQALSHAESHRYPVHAALASTVLAKAYIALGDPEKAESLKASAERTAFDLKLPEVEAIVESVTMLLESSTDNELVVRFASECRRLKLNVYPRLLERVSHANGLNTITSAAEFFGNGLFDKEMYVLNQGIREQRILEPVQED